MALEDKCFIEWRGDTDWHRSYDVMIGSKDVDWIRGEISQKVQRFCKAIPLPREGSVIAIGNYGSNMQTVDAEPKFSVCTGKGPKLVVNPDYIGPPVRISEIREELPYDEQLQGIADTILRTLFWDDLRQNIRGKAEFKGVLFSFPKILMPLLEINASLERTHFITDLQAEIYEVIKFGFNGKTLPFDRIKIKYNNEADLPLVEFHAV